MDSGLDAPTPPADAWRPIDADLDAPIPDGDPGWFHLAALPEECPIDVATYPERAAPPLVWTDDCGPGCRSWGDTANMVVVGGGASEPVAALVSPPRTAAEVGLFQYWLFIGLESNRVLMALRAPEPSPDPDVPVCAIVDAGIGAGTIATTVVFYDFDMTGNVIENQWISVLRGSTTDPGEPPRLLRRLDFGSITASMMRVSPTHVAAMYNWELVRAFAEDGSLLEPTSGLEEFFGPKSNLELLQGADLVWEQYRSPTVMVGSRNGAPPVVLRAVDGGGVRGSDVRSTTADGDTLVWLEARHWDDTARAYDSVELWTGRYDAGEILEARSVAQVVGHYEGVAGAGLYVHAEPFPDPTDAFFAFYRLSDGARAVFDPSPDSRGANRVLYVSDDMVITESFGQKYWIDPRELTFEAP